MNTQIADNKTSDILLNRIKHYYQCSIWLLRDGLEAFQKQIVFILSLNILGVALAGIGLSGIFLVVKHLENKKSFQLYGLEFHFSTSILEVLVLIIACIALGLLSACILYYTERTIADTTAAYQKHCILKVAKIAGDPDYDGWQILADQSPQKTVAGLCGTTCQIVSLAFRNLLKGILPLIILLFAVSCMFVIDPVFSLALVPFAGVYIVPFYLINSSAYQLQKNYKTHAPKTKGALSNALKNAVENESELPEKMQSIQNIINGDDYTTMASMFWGRRLLKGRLQLVNMALLYLCILSLFIIFYIRSDPFERNWSALLLYFIALRFTFGTLGSVSSLFVKLSRYFSELTVYRAFVKTAEKIKNHQNKTAATSQKWPESLSVKIPSSSIQQDRGDSFVVINSRLAWIIHSGSVTFGDLKTTAVFFEKHLEHTVNITKNVLFHHSPEALLSMKKDVTLMELLGGFSTSYDQSKNVRAKLEPYKILEEIDGLPSGFNTRINEPEIRKLSDKALYAISFLSKSKTPEAVFLSAKFLLEFESDFNNHLLASYPSAYKFIVTNKPENVFNQAFASVNDPSARIMIMNGQRLVAYGNLAWLKKNLSTIKNMLIKEAAADRRDDEFEFEL